jgi:hypothetical protein
MKRTRLKWAVLFASIFVTMTMLLSVSLRLSRHNGRSELEHPMDSMHLEYSSTDHPELMDLEYSSTDHPELNLFIKCFNMVKLEMTRVQVDNILHDYPSEGLQERGPEMPFSWSFLGANQAIRPCLTAKCYFLYLHGGTKMKEGDCLIAVFFDHDGLVVWKAFDKASS